MKAEDDDQPPFGFAAFTSTVQAPPTLPGQAPSQPLE